MLCEHLQQNEGFDQNWITFCLSFWLGYVVVNDICLQGMEVFVLFYVLESTEFLKWRSLKDYKQLISRPQ